MDQPTFADLEYQGKQRKTRRELFLEGMDSLIPWQLLKERIRPFNPKAGKGRRPYPLAVMLRIHCVQLFYNLSDPGMEDPRFHGGRLCFTRLSRCGVLRGCGCRNRGGPADEVMGEECAQIRPGVAGQAGARSNGSPEDKSPGWTFTKTGGTDASLPGCGSSKPNSQLPALTGLVQSIPRFATSIRPL